MLHNSPNLPIPARPSIDTFFFLIFQQWSLGCIKDLVPSHHRAFSLPMLSSYRGPILRAPPSHSRAPAWGCGIMQACAGPWSFGSVAEYGAFLRPRLRPTTRLVAVAGERKGDRGTFLQSGNSISPCQVQWDAYGKPFWVRWSDVALEVYHPNPATHRLRPASGR